MSTLKPSSLYRVIYISSAAELLSEAELDSILAASRRNNTRSGLTGLLLYHDGAFLQVLEGENEEIQVVLDRIRRDRRHSGIITLSSSSVAERAFEQWSMGFIPYQTLSEDQKAGFRDLTQYAEQGAGLFTGDARVQGHIRSFLSCFREFELL